MKITRENYESWFLDYWEGNLDEPGMEMVRQFGIQHPDLAEELSNLPPSLAANPALSFSGKERLKRCRWDHAEEFEEDAISYLEGDMDPDSQKDFERWMATRPERQDILHQYASCKLKPKLADHFPGREKLKRKFIRLSMWSRIAVAAAVVLIALLAIYPLEHPERTLPPIAAANKDNNTEKPQGKPTEIAAIQPVTTSKTNFVLVNANRKPAKKSTDREAIEPIGAKYARPLNQIAMLVPKTGTVGTYEPAFTDLVPVQPMRLLDANLASKGEIMLSDYYSSKLQSLKAANQNEFITREEVAFAGLRLFSKLPGRHLTAKKGGDGRIRSINFNTQLLAFSIPVHREL